MSNNTIDKCELFFQRIGETSLQGKIVENPVNDEYIEEYKKRMEYRKQSREGYDDVLVSLAEHLIY